MIDVVMLIMAAVFAAMGGHIAYPVLKFVEKKGATDLARTFGIVLIITTMVYGFVTVIGEGCGLRPLTEMDMIAFSVLFGATIGLNAAVALD